MVFYVGGLASGVFLFSGLVDILSERLSVHTIPLYGCMYRLSSYTPFSYQE